MSGTSNDQLYIGRKLFRDQLYDNNKCLQNNNSFVDVTLVTDDNVTMQAHKLVLSANSSVLANILLSNPLPCPILYLRGIKKHELSSLLDLMYTGETKICQSEVDELLKIAKEFKLRDFFSVESEIEIKPYEPNIEGIVINDKGNSFIKEPAAKLKSIEIFENNLEILNEENSNSEAQASMSTVECADELLNMEFGLSHGEEKTSVEQLESNATLETSLERLDMDACVNPTNCGVVDNGVEENCAETLNQGFGSKEIVQYATEEGKGANKEINQVTKHQCNYCSYESKFLDGLKRHIKADHEGVLYSCKECDKKYKNRTDLKVHEQVKHKGIGYPCKVCHTYCSSPGALKIHTDTQHGNFTPFPCKYCKYVAKNKKRVNQHILRLHSSTLVVCDQCDFQTNHERKLKLHQTHIHSDVKHSCDLCEYKASTKEIVKMHKKTEHEGVRYSCDQCEYQATQKVHLKLHQRAQHEGAKFLCDECDFRTTQPGHLKSHKRNIHSKEPPSKS